MTASYVYAIRMENTNFFKIGETSKDINERKLALQTGNPYNLQVFAFFPSKLEKVYHYILKDYHIRGEWFDISPDLLVFILSISSEKLKALIGDRKRGKGYNADYYRNNKKYREYLKWYYINIRPKRMALKTKKLILTRIRERKQDNNRLRLSFIVKSKNNEIEAFRKMLYLDNTAQYYRAPNDNGGYDYIIQSERIYGREIDSIEYDFENAIRIARSTGQRQTGQLYSKAGFK